MGSLMAGWDSPRTSKKGFERNLSLTKEEIQQYWKNRPAEEKCTTSASLVVDSTKKSLQNSSTFSTSQNEARFIPLSQKELLKSKTFSGRGAMVEVQPSLAPGSAPSVWWTKTDWAFLNEPPVLEPLVEGRSSKYISQHNVSKLKMAESIV